MFKSTMSRMKSLQLPNRTITLLVVILSSSPLFVTLTQSQSSISLNRASWFVTNANESIHVAAQVPGGIYSDLRRANILKQDILYGKNDLNYRWVGHENWTYSTIFTIDLNIARSQSVNLVLHGVDTVATVILNGHELGTTDNMFVRYKFDMKPSLKLAGLENVLLIRFESPIKYSARKSNQSVKQHRGKIIPPYCPSPAQKGECHVNFIRKMQASFSWDWGPAFPSVGLYKDVSIEFGSFGIIRDVLVETKRLSPVYHPATTTTRPAPLSVTSNARNHFRTYPNRTVPYMRAPPYYSGFGANVQPGLPVEPLLSDPSVSIEPLLLLEENWLLRITIVIEMVQANFGYNMRVEFNLDEILHYESEHFNVIANSEATIRLGFNLRIDPMRMMIKPWWPNNAGNQTLYKLVAKVMPIPNAPDSLRMSRIERLSDGPTEYLDLQFRHTPLRTPTINPMLFFASTIDPNTNQISQKEIHFGFRTIDIIQEPVRGDPENGLTFNFRVNGVDLFSMGSNWIPAAVLPEYSNDFDYIRYLLQSAKDANMNMLRVWGGGLYESDEFYKMADEMGIMIWQDLMFACALYPTDEDFLATVRVEIEQQVQRLQYHPSVVVWASNNENEMAIAGPWWPEVLMWNTNLRESYQRLYVDTIRPIVQILDPSRPVLNSSPSNGIVSQSQPNSISKIPNDPKYGDIHHYDYLSDSFDWTNYPSTRFASEYGFQSYPSFNALTSVSSPADWKYPLTANILHRQHRLTGEAEIRIQMKMHFNEVASGGANKLKTFIYLTQLYQAIAIKTESEFYRRNRFIDPETGLGKTMGALYWQLNDVWQAPTWSSIEYGGKWKMLHYFARRFFFPIQVIPYIIQPTTSVLQQAFPISSNILTNIYNRLHSNETTPSQPEIPPQPSNNQVFALDLVRDDLFHLLHSFNITIKFFRWTSFTPIFQDTIFVENSRPQNVTRIYEKEIPRILRSSYGTFTLSSGVFQVIIEQQPHLGLSQIENFLIPVAPSKITAMRLPKISAPLIQGPFEVSNVHSDSRSSGSGLQWSCAYRITITTDSIAMFVWLDLNLLDQSSQFDEFSNYTAPNDKLHDPNGAIRLKPMMGSNGPHPTISSQHYPIRHTASPYSGFREESELIQNLHSPIPAKLVRTDELNLLHLNFNQKIPQQFKPVRGTGSDMLRYQFSDNAFQMFEPSMLVDLYLSQCLSKTEVETSLEIQSLIDGL